MSTFMSIKDFQEEFRVSRSTVYRLKARGEIAFVRVGRAVRIKVEEANRWCASLNCQADNDL